MDLSTLIPSERIVEILSPGKKEPIGVRVTLVHINDERLTKLKRKFADERYRLESRGKQIKAEEVENNANELAFAAMTGWEFYNPTGKPGDQGFDEKAHANWKGDKSPQFNKKNVLEIFNTPGMDWFRDQIGKEMGEDEAFFPR